MKYKVYIIGFTKQDYLGEYSSQEECWTAMFDFLKIHNFTSYYQRRIRDSDTETTVDFGSHNVFFKIISDNAVNKNEYSIDSAPIAKTRR